MYPRLTNDSALICHNFATLQSLILIQTQLCEVRWHVAANFEPTQAFIIGVNVIKQNFTKQSLVVFLKVNNSWTITLKKVS